MDTLKGVFFFINALKSAVWFMICGLLGHFSMFNVLRNRILSTVVVFPIFIAFWEERSLNFNCWGSI